MSQQWMKNAEQDIPDAQAYDWTYSSGYRGAAVSLMDGKHIEPSETTDKIDFESLKVGAKDLKSFSLLSFSVCGAHCFA
jgi:hypothetical protein